MCIHIHTYIHTYIYIYIYIYIYPFLIFFPFYNFFFLTISLISIKSKILVNYIDNLASNFVYQWWYIVSIYTFLILRTIFSLTLIWWWIVDNNLRYFFHLYYFIRMYRQNQRYNLLDEINIKNTIDEEVTRIV